MNFFIAFAMFICYGFGCAVAVGAREAGASTWVQILVQLPFEVGAYLILASQVGLHV